MVLSDEELLLLFNQLVLIWSYSFWASLAMTAWLSSPLEAFSLADCAKSLRAPAKRSISETTPSLLVSSGS